MIFEPRANFNSNLTHTHTSYTELSTLKQVTRIKITICKVYIRGFMAILNLYIWKLFANIIKQTFQMPNRIANTKMKTKAKSQSTDIWCKADTWRQTSHHLFMAKGCQHHQSGKDATTRHLAKLLITQHTQ